MKQIFFFLFLFFSLLSVAQEQDSLSLQKGSFAYKYYIGDKIVSSDAFFHKLAGNQQALEMAQSGKNLSILGTVVGCLGAFGIGYDLGQRIGGGNGHTGLFLGGAVVMFGGLVIDKLGNLQIKKALSLYNEQRRASASLNISATGLGLAITF